jgi:hypothetical protein
MSAPEKKKSNLLGDMSPWEEILVLKIGLIAGATVAGSIFTAATWHKILHWLVDHDALVPAKESPLVEIPAGNGVGLDATRTALAIAVVVFLLISSVAAVRHRAEQRRRELL